MTTWRQALDAAAEDAIEAHEDSRADMREWRRGAM